MDREFQLDDRHVAPQLHQVAGPEGTEIVEAHSMEVLIALAERAGEVVSRQELLDRVWGELYVGEEVLSHAIWDLRRALGDDPRAPRFIHTHRKRGYRLVAKVSWLEHGVGDTGRYRLIERVGGGAMGIVWKGEDSRLGRTVALKFLPPEWCRDEIAKARFLREAKTAAALDHPNLCTLLEIDETDDGRLFLVMPFYEGKTLREVLAEAPLEADRAVAIGLQIASGLVALHDLGIVHRDLKPANILIVDGSGAKILDFGLAKFAGSTRLTQVGSSPGTPAYMSPEQVLGEEATPSSDVWALGAVLYECLAGRPPFGGANDDATFYAIKKSEPESLISVGVPEDLSRVIGKALFKRRTARYGSARELRSALQPLGRTGTAVSALPTPRRAGGGPLEAPWLWLRSYERPSPDLRRLVETGGDIPDQSTRRQEWKHRWRAVASLAVTLVITIVVATMLSRPWTEDQRRSDPRSADAPLPERIAVLPFENRTGDPDLEGIGIMAADLVASGLTNTGRVTVVPVATTRGESAAADLALLEPAEHGDEFEAATAARLVVSGSYYLNAGELHFRADALDLAEGEILRSFGPVAVERTEAPAAIDELKERLMSLVSLRVDLPDLEPAVFSSIPRYPVYQDFWAGISTESIADQASARKHLIRAYENDPSFVMSELYLAGAPVDLLLPGIRDIGLQRLDAQRHRLTPFERYLTDAFLNQNRGRWADAFLQLQEAERLAPRSPWINAQISDTALRLNMPEYALLAMDKIPDTEMQSGFARWRRVVNRGYALHMLGRYEEELEFARRGLELLPNLPSEPRYAQIRALAALGRLAELDRALDLGAADVTPVWPGHDAWGLVASALQLRAHGYPVEAREYALRAVEYSENVESAANDPRVHGWALWLLGRFDDAYKHHTRLLEGRPDSIILRGEVGCLAALRGDREEALEHADRIARNPKPYVYGARAIMRGLIMAHLGQLDRAVELISEGLAAGAGYKEARVHYHVFLSPLLGYPPYEELVRPKG